MTAEATRPHRSKGASPGFVLRAGKRIAYRAVFGTRYDRVPTYHRPYVRPFEARMARLFYDRLIRRTPAITVEEYATRVPLSEIEEYIPCLLCEEQTFQPLFRPANSKNPAKPWRYHVVRCPSCGLLYRNPNVRPERLGDLYRKRYSTFLTGEYAETRRLRYRLTLDAFSPWFDEGGGRRLFDFGCGTGLFLELAHERGFDVYGIDLSADSIHQARRRPGGERTWSAHPREVPEIARGGFDIVTMWSVLAHLPRAAEELRMLRSLLAPGGMLMVFTVNANSLLLKRSRDTWNGFTKNHLFFYSRETVPVLLRQAGFGRVEFRDFYQDDVESGRSDLPPAMLMRLRRIVEAGQDNMLRLVAFNEAPGSV